MYLMCRNLLNFLLDFENSGIGMIGVVLWSDPSDRKAVFWCEDHGELAFYNQCVEAQEQDAFFAAGDMVQFDVRMAANMRRALNARLLHEGACVGLSDHLLSPTDQIPANNTGTVVPFHRADRAVPSQPKKRASR